MNLIFTSGELIKVLETVMSCKIFQKNIGENIKEVFQRFCLLKYIFFMGD